MVFDNRVNNGMDEDIEAIKTDKDPNVNAEIDQVNLEDRVTHNVLEKSGEINNVTDLEDAFSKIRSELPKSNSSADLIELYRQGGDLIKLLNTALFAQKVGEGVGEMRAVAEEQFARTAREINMRATEIGAKSHFAEKWGD